MYTYSVSGYDVNNKVCVLCDIYFSCYICCNRRITTIFRYFPVRGRCRNYSAFIIDLCVVRKSICRLMCLFFLQRFSPCSLRSIRKVLQAKSGRCFSEPEESFCGNLRVEGDEECDAGLLGTEDSDHCCDKNCKLRRTPGVNCRYNIRTAQTYLGGFT